MKNLLSQSKKIILTRTFMVAAVAANAAILVAPTVQQMLPSAYAATASGSSAATEGACSSGSFADNFLASVSGSCGPNSSGSAAGPVALCKGDDSNISLAIQGTCSISN